MEHILVLLFTMRSYIKEDTYTHIYLYQYVKTDRKEKKKEKDNKEETYLK